MNLNSDRDQINKIELKVLLLHIEISMRFGFSMYCFNLWEKRATLAPSMILWSAVILKVMQSIGSHMISLPSTYFGTLCDLPMAIIAADGRRIVGTKYLPPIFPTLLTAKVPLLKSSWISLSLLDRSIKSLRSLLISKMLFVCTFLMLGVVSPCFESMATEKLWSALITYYLI